MDWTRDLAVEADARVRSDLHASRAGLIQFVAEGAWSLLPSAPGTAAAYVQDAAGVKRSEAYRLVATARIAHLLLTRFVQGTDDALSADSYRWVVEDVIRSTHTGEWLCSITHDLVSEIEQAVGRGADPRETIADVVRSRPRPSGDESQVALSYSDDSGREEAARQQTVDDLAIAGPTTGPGQAAPTFDLNSLERAQRLIICPHCGNTIV